MGLVAGLTLKKRVFTGVAAILVSQWSGMDLAPHQSTPGSQARLARNVAMVSGHDEHELSTAKLDQQGRQARSQNRKSKQRPKSSGHGAIAPPAALTSVEPGNPGEPCLIEDVECLKLPEETVEQHCARVLKAKEAGNPGYGLAHCDSGFNVRWIPPKERVDLQKEVKLPKTSPAVGATISTYVSPVVSNNHNPIAEAAGGATKTAILLFRDTDFIRYCQTKGWIQIPEDATLGKVGFETLMSTFEALPRLGVKTRVGAQVQMMERTQVSRPMLRGAAGAQPEN